MSTKVAPDVTFSVLRRHSNAADNVGIPDVTGDRKLIFMASNIRTYLRRERRKWGLTQRELARLLGLRGGTQVSRIERGRNLPSVRTLMACQTLFGLTPAQLFPHLTAGIDEELLRQAKSLYEALKINPTLRAQRKRELLVLSLKRAISRSSPDQS